VGFAPTFYFWTQGMENASIGQRVTEIGKRVATERKLEFVHSEIAGSKRNPTVRIFIDKPGGVTIEDCTDVSRDVEALLDADDFIPSSYVLEVSSPGIERELYSIDDFRRFIGHQAKVKADAVNGQRNFSGRIVSVDDGVVVFEDKTAGTVQIPYDGVKKANLLIDLETELKKR
jgi:ribosome maturation factor RimP